MKRKRKNNYFGDSPQKKNKKQRKDSLKYTIKQFYLLHTKKMYNAREIRHKLKLTDNIDLINAALVKLYDQNFLGYQSGGKYFINKEQLELNSKSKSNTKSNQKSNNRPDRSKKSSKSRGYIGKVDMTKSGSAFILVDDLEEDVFVRNHDMAGALNGDKVRVLLKKRQGRRPEGEIVKIIERSTEMIMGIFRIYNKNGVVYNLNTRQNVDVYIKPNDYAEAVDGDIVVAHISSWGTNQNKNIWGEITKVLSDNTENDIAMQSILVENGFELDFPDKVIEEVRNLDVEISEKEISRRRDMRDITTFTIDPLTAKDFDDALSVEYKEDGTIEVGVHIADVSHYVKERTALDKEAYKRSTSVYLVDRVLPMLPERLSNELCSLRPNEEKCTFSAVFTFNKSNNIIKEWFGKTVTYSDRRFTYEEAQEVIETQKGDYSKEILELNRLAGILRKSKFKNGAIDFESEEVVFRLDEDAVPIEVHVKERKDAHKLVEEFMLLANKHVAKFIAKKSKGVEIPMVYRIHDLPDQERLVNFSLFAKEMGYTMKIDTPNQVVKSFNDLAKAAQKDEALKLLLPLAIRTMSKAVYTTDNIGHYGLGFENYTHFTSPIRRYSDVLVHRILHANLEKATRVNKASLEAQCTHISTQERNATKAERSSIKYKQVEYMTTKIGQEFDGFVSGMIDKGIFVEIEDVGAEGLIPFSKFDESFTLADSKLKAKSKSGKTYKMGDRVRVVVLEADLENRLIEMEIVEK